MNKEAPCSSSAHILCRGIRCNTLCLCYVTKSQEAEAGIEFLTEKLSGFEEDTMEYSPNATEDDFYVIYQKTLPEPVAPTAPAADVSKVASTTAVKPKAPLSEDNSN